MFLVEDGVIYLTRGDYAELEVAITDSEGNAYEMVYGDTLTFSVRETPSDDSTLQFSVTSQTNRLIINHVDTAKMEPGQYSADVQLTSIDGKRRTVWAYVPDQANRRGRTSNWKNFVLMPEVTTE